jgi:hypothetical protein
MVGYSSWWNNREEREIWSLSTKRKKTFIKLRWSINKHWLGLLCFWFSWSIRCGTKRAGRARQNLYLQSHQRNIRYFSNLLKNCRNGDAYVIRFKTQLVKPAFARYHPWWREIWN